MKLIKLCLLTCFLFLASCGESVDCNDTAAINAELDPVLNRLTEVTLSLFSDPENNDICNELKDTYKDYIDLLEKFEECFVESGQEEEYRQSLQDARDGLDDLEC